MASKKEAKPKTSYIVQSANTGVRKCGPYGSKAEADRECKRLNKEAQTDLGHDGHLINFQVVWACSRCKASPERDAMTGWLVCRACHNYDVPMDGQEYELLEVDRKPKLILHEGVPQSYEVVSGEGVVLP